MRNEDISDLARDAIEYSQARVTEAEEAGTIADALEAMHDINTRFAEAAKDIALTGVANEVLTRREAGGLLGVHPITVSRWLTARETEQPE